MDKLGSVWEKKEEAEKFFFKFFRFRCQKIGVDDSKSDGGGSSSSKTLKSYKKQKKFYL